MNLISGKDGKQPSTTSIIGKALDHNGRNIFLMDITYSDVRAQRAGMAGYENTGMGIDPETKVVTMADAQNIFQQVCALMGGDAFTEIVIEISNYNVVVDERGFSIDMHSEDQFALFGRWSHDVKPKKKYIFSPGKNRLQIMQGGDYVYENYDGSVTRDGAAIAEC